MENKGTLNADGIDSDFSVILQQLFQQAQTENEVRNCNPSFQFGPSPVNNLQLPAHDDTYRYEPLFDPALSFISDILAEDDDMIVNQPIEFNAYQAKASEIAALLNEDSPSLVLNVEGESSVSTEDVVSPSLSDFEAVHGSYLDQDSPFFLCGNVPELYRNALLLNSLRGPVNWSTASSSSLQTQLLEGRYLDIFGNELLSTLAHVQVDTLGGDGNLHRLVQADVLGHGQFSKSLQGGIQEDSCIRSHIPKPPKPEKMGRVLKLKKESSLSYKKSGGKARSSRGVDKECVELNDLLLQCAQAVGVNNKKMAMEILKKVRQHASPYGNGAERLAHYFAEAMEARFSGTGWPLYMGLLGRHPSSSEILKATYLYMSSCPFVKAYHYFINQTILNVARGVSKLDILELQIDGFQYPALFKALAERPGGPPQVHLIGLGFPHYSSLPVHTDVVLEAVQKTGRQLSDYAASCGVPFEYTAWAGIRDDLRMQDFVSPFRKEGEILVIISASLLRYVMDDTLDSPVVRSKLLKQAHDLNPEVYVQGIVTGSYSTPFFTRRFREALFHFESVFDMLDTFISREQMDRHIFEGDILGKAILNIVACEGTQVVDRVGKYKHWQAVTEEVGFKQLPLDKEIKGKVQLMLKTWHKEYIVGEDSQYLLMGWKGRMLHAMSIWNAYPEDST